MYFLAWKDSVFFDSISRRYKYNYDSYVSCISLPLDTAELMLRGSRRGQNRYDSTLHSTYTLIHMQIYIFTDIRITQQYNRSKDISCLSSTLWRRVIIVTMCITLVFIIIGEMLDFLENLKYSLCKKLLKDINMSVLQKICCQTTHQCVCFSSVAYLIFIIFHYEYKYFLNNTCIVL